MLTKEKLTKALGLLDEADRDYRVILLQEFMRQEDILGLEDQGKIHWFKFMLFVETKDQMFLFGCFNPASPADKLFLDFKGNGHLLPPIISSFLSEKDLAAVSQVSRGAQAFFASSLVLVATGEHKLKNEFLELGINERVVDELFKKRRVRNFKKLYQKLKRLFRRPKFDGSFSRKTIRDNLSSSTEALIVFSGEVDSLIRFPPPERGLYSVVSAFSSNEMNAERYAYLLRLAVWSGSVPMLEAIWRLLDYRLLGLNDDISLALTDAIKSGSVEMFDACIPKLEALKRGGWIGGSAGPSPFFDAADAGSVDMFFRLHKELHDNFFDASQDASQRDSLFCRVARSGSLPVMRLIWETWCLSPRFDEVGQQILAQAALSGNKEMAIFALDQLLRRDMPRVPSPLYCEQDFAYFAARSGSVEMMRLVSPDAADIAPHALGAAVRSGSVAAVEFACKEWGLVPSSRAEYTDLGLQYSDGVSLRVADRAVSLLKLAGQSRNPRMLEIVDSLLLARDHHPEPPQAAGVAAGPRA